MNYKIISDEVKLREFIEWLPELEDNEKYYCSLFARKKYCNELIKSNDKTQLKRFTSNKERLFEKINQLEVELGAYSLRYQVVPQESLVLYITPNPRCMKKATFKMMNKGLKLIEGGNNYNIHAEALSCIQNSKSRTCFVDFDIDDKAVMDIEKLNVIIPKDSYDLIETRGGYHLLVKPKLANEGSKMWYNLITETFKPDQTGDQMIPVVGTYQGGFTPKFI